MQASLSAALSPGPVRTFESAAVWWADHSEMTRSIEQPIDRAIVGATVVDRLGYAFAGGYAAALSSLVPTLPRGTLASLAATEDGGAHPRAITTELTRDGAHFVLTGKKRWVTLGPEGGVVLVVARRAETAGSARPELVVARVPADARGVTVTPLAHMPFVPEIPHAELSLERVRVLADDVLPGDGYERYLKPFRTIEDLHVHAALLGWLSSIGARAGWPAPIRERLVSLLVTVRALAAEDPSSAVTHVALGGALSTAQALVLEIDPLWAMAPEETRTLFARDRALLSIAGKARAARLAKAWSRLGS
jgi:acyl-CoA dehydrogenase